jgi:hypothetical protein
VGSNLVLVYVLTSLPACVGLRLISQGLKKPEIVSQYNYFVINIDCWNDLIPTYLRLLVILLFVTMTVYVGAGALSTHGFATNACKLAGAMLVFCPARSCPIWNDCHIYMFGLGLVFTWTLESTMYKGVTTLFNQLR